MTEKSDILLSSTEAARILLERAHAEKAERPGRASVGTDATAEEERRRKKIYDGLIKAGAFFPPFF